MFPPHNLGTSIFIDSNNKFIEPIRKTIDTNIITNRDITNHDVNDVFVCLSHGNISDTIFKNFRIMGIPVINTDTNNLNTIIKKIDYFKKIKNKQYQFNYSNSNKINFKQHLKVIIVIYTFNRTHMLLNQLYLLHHQIYKHHIDLYVRIYDDGSHPKPKLPNNFNFNIHYHYFDSNHGKKMWHLFIHFIYQDLQHKSFDFLIFLADDFLFNHLFIQTSIDYFVSINDINKVTLTLSNDRNTSWVKFSPISFNQHVIHCQWTESAFICNRRFLHAMNYGIHHFKPIKSGTSSGVPRFLTITLHKQRLNMYIPNKSLAYNEDNHVSVMDNDIETRDLTSRNYYEHDFYINKSAINKFSLNAPIIVASLCSIPSRLTSLQHTIQSILPHVNMLHIFLNNYNSIPDFLVHSQIIVALSQDYGNFGDANKFFWADKLSNCYHFFCDDDLIYTKKYFEHHLQKQKKYGDRCPTSYCGALIDIDDPNDFINYYSSRTQIHISNTNISDISAHIVGTGALCCHSSSISGLSINDFKHPNMADIWFGLFCQLNHIPLIIISKDQPLNNYIKHSEHYDQTNTIYYKSVKLKKPDIMNTSDIQTQVIRIHLPWSTFHFNIKPSNKSKIYHTNHINSTSNKLKPTNKSNNPISDNDHSALSSLLGRSISINHVHLLHPKDKYIKKFNGKLLIISYPFNNNKIYRISIDKFNSDNTNIETSLFINQHTHLQKIPVSILDPTLRVNINYIDTYTYLNILFLIIKNNQSQPFTINSLAINELDFPLGNKEINNKKLLNVPDIPIYKTNYHKTLHVACLLDNFSFRCFEYEFHLYPLTRATWKQTLNKPIDFVLFESAWHGSSAEWSGCISKYNKASNNLVTNIIKYIDSKKLTKVFYNKEDPVHFDLFSEFASCFNKKNDCIITTDDTMVSRYRQLGCPNVFSFPFCCQPIIHNPINKDTYPNPDKNIFFPCSYYAKIFPERCQEMILMVDSYIDQIDIYDRHYIFNKLSLQINQTRNYRRTYQFPNKYKNNIKGSLQYDQVLYLYKKYRCVMNINTVITSNTMFARRVVEAAASGSPIISNDSLGVKSIYGSNVIHYSDKDNVRKLLNDDNYRLQLGDKLYKLAMHKYTYSHLTDKLLSVLPQGTLKRKNTVKDTCLCMIFLDNPQCLQRFKSHFNSKEYDYVIISNTFINKKYNIITYPHISSIKKYKYYAIMQESCFYHRSYINNMLLPTLYTDAIIIGKGCYYYKTKDVVVSRHLEHRFTNRLNLNTLVIKLNHITKLLFNSDFLTNVNNYLVNNFNNKNMYSTDKYDFFDQHSKYHYYPANSINLSFLYSHRESNNTFLKIVMCCWKRIDSIKSTIRDLNVQTDRNFELYIWNNNFDKKNVLESHITSSHPHFNIHVHHSHKNVGGIGRFYLTHHLLKHTNFRYVIFIDDDQSFGDELVANFRSHAKPNHSFNWYGRRFRKGYPYRQLNKNGRPINDASDPTKLANINIGSEFHYGGTGGMIIDTRVFNNIKLFYDLPKEYLFVEDLWLSFYAKHIYNYKIIRIEQQIRTFNDKQDQCHHLWDLKNHLLEYCRDLGWNV